MTLCYIAILQQLGLLKPTQHPGSGAAVLLGRAQLSITVFGLSEGGEEVYYFTAAYLQGVMLWLHSWGAKSV